MTCIGRIIIIHLLTHISSYATPNTATLRFPRSFFTCCCSSSAAHCAAFVHRAVFPPVFGRRSNRASSSSMTSRELLMSERFQGNGYAQQGSEQRLRDRHLGALESDPPGVAHQLCPDLYELQLDASERPVGSLSWKGEAAEEVAEIVCQHERGEADLAGGEAIAGEPCPGECALPFPDPLLAFRPAGKSTPERACNLASG